MAITSTLTDSEMRDIAYGGHKAPGVLLGKLTTLDTEINLKATTASPTLTGTTVITGQLANYGMWTHAGATMTVASQGVAVAIIGTTAAKGDANGWTVGTDGTFTATFLGTKTVRVQAVISMAPIATNVDALTLHVAVAGSSVFESAENTINDTTPELYEVDFMTDVANGETVTLLVENTDVSAANIIIDAYVDRIDTAPSSGWMTVMTV